MTGLRIRVLVVDDHALVRDMLAERLAAEGDFEVVGVAGDARVALGLAREHRPDVVLMDVDMPGRSPFDAALELGRQPSAPRVLFISGYLNDSYIEQALAVEGAGYVSKTESVEAIIQALRRVARGAVYFSPQVRKRIVIDNGGARLAPGFRSRLQTLTPREREILVYLARGLAKKEIARLAAISPKTVDQHCSHIMDKLDIHDRVGLAHYAIREGLVEA